MGHSGRGLAVQNFSDPALHGLKAWSLDSASSGQSAVAVTAATIYLTKINIVNGFTAANLHFNLQVSGTGAVAMSNAQCGLYSSAGVLLGYSTAADMAAGGSAACDEATAPASLSVALTAASSGLLALSGGTWVWGGLHIGTQASTAAQFSFGTNAGTTVANFNLAVSTARSGTYTGHASNALATIGNLTPASISLFTRALLMGIS